MTSPAGARERARRARQSARDKGERMAGKTNGHTVQEAAEAAIWQDRSQTTTVAPQAEPEVLSISFREWDEDEETLPSGRIIRKRKRSDRVAEIDTFVPAKVIYQFFGQLDQVPQVLLQWPRTPDGTPSSKVPLSFFGQDTQKWVYEQVLVAWQLSEPDMDLERLMTGIAFEEAFKLWAQFYTGPLVAIFGGMTVPPASEKQE